jgi:NAD(P)-dependent dehydrogenase (short-subunit alcohol dehydrogenase family)
VGTLAGRVAIVTGAGRGFGRAIAMGLAAEGASVALVARSQADLEAVRRDIVSAGGRAVATPADVTSRGEVERAVKDAEAALGPVSLLISCAGIGEPYGPVGVVDPDAWWQAQAVHLRGPLLFVSALLPGMRERRQGRIVTISAIAGNRVTPNLSAYGMGKNAQIRLVQHIAAEQKDFGIAAFAIEPGTAVTDLAESTIADPDAQRWLPGMVAALTKMRDEKRDPAPVFARCAEMCVALGSGKYDALSGRYLEPWDDFDALLREAPDRN